ncbi:zinc-ribbon domain-containing protein [Butyrivibrio fibrisolvens]|uniref:zinc-ribbon domain-containing protein n=1 Tax=Butyrivibrio fibrisolvens TaxID=831 RepID=UPI0006878CB9|nr:zinc-ribbon domain-containing protein [Butyrivibrio fibrisolvens]
MKTVNNKKQEDSLAFLMPYLVEEWVYELNDDKKPENYTCGSHQKVFWRCEKGYVWEAEIKGRVKGNGCPYCSGNKVLTGYNDFAARCQDKMKMWNYEKNTNIQPDQIYYRSSKKIWWKCDNGHEWEARVRAISTGSGCIYCNKQRIQKGVNDLETLYPEIIKLWDYERNILKPSEVFPKSSKKVHWICSKGHRWSVNVHSVVDRGGSCPVCSKKG